MGDEPPRGRRVRRGGRQACEGGVFFFSSRRRHTRSVSAFLLNRSSDLGIPAEPLFRSDGSNKLNRSRKARVSYKVQRTINASLNAATSTRAVSSNPNFVTRQKIEIIFG